MYIDTVPNRSSPPAILLRQSLRQGRRVVKPNPRQPLPVGPRPHRGPPPRPPRRLRPPAPPNPPAAWSSAFCSPSNTSPTNSASPPPSAKPASPNWRCSSCWPALPTRARACRPSAGPPITPSPKCSGWAPSTRTICMPPSTIFAPARNPSNGRLYRQYLKRRGAPPTLFLYDVTSSYMEGEHNALGEYGYNRDGKRGKLQIVIGLLADREGEPLAVRVFAGNTGDPTTVVEQIRIVKEQFGVRGVDVCGRPGDGQEQRQAGAQRGRAALHQRADRSADPPAAERGHAADGPVPRRGVRSGGRRGALPAAEERRRRPRGNSTAWRTSWPS